MRPQVAEGGATNSGTSLSRDSAAEPSVTSWSSFASAFSVFAQKILPTNLAGSAPESGPAESHTFVNSLQRQAVENIKRSRRQGWRDFASAPVWAEEPPEVEVEPNDYNNCTNQPNTVCGAQWLLLWTTAAYAPEQPTDEVMFVLL